MERTREDGREKERERLSGVSSGGAGRGGGGGQGGWSKQPYFPGKEEYFPGKEADHLMIATTPQEMMSVEASVASGLAECFHLSTIYSRAAGTATGV